VRTVFSTTTIQKTSAERTLQFVSVNATRTHVKRLRLRAEPTKCPTCGDVAGVTFISFTPARLADHGLALWAAFRDGPDTIAFPALGTETGCRDLMHALASLPTLFPAATWLAMKGVEPAGTIQCTFHTDSGEAEIHNLGVGPDHRNCGLGSALLARCLAALTVAGCRRVFLDVTASNEPALRLYRKFGFRPYKTVYVRAYGTAPSLGLDI
jgi:ribosomal protein S18 acetylase RimI-like enzyme